MGFFFKVSVALTGCQSAVEAWPNISHLEKMGSEPIKICLTTWLQHLCSWQKLCGTARLQHQSQTIVEQQRYPRQAAFKYPLVCMFSHQENCLCSGEKSPQGKLCYSSGVQYQWTNCEKHTHFPSTAAFHHKQLVFKDDSYENTGMTWSLRLQISGLNKKVQVCLVASDVAQSWMSNEMNKDVASRSRHVGPLQTLWWLIWDTCKHLTASVLWRVPAATEMGKSRRRPTEICSH